MDPDDADREALRARLAAVGNCPRPAVRVLADEISGRYDEGFERIGMNSAQFTLLAAIGWAGTSTLTGLTQYVARDQTTLSRGVEKLRQRGWVEVAPQAHDRRQHVVRLTDAGRLQLGAAMDAWEVVREELEQALGREALAQLVQVSWAAVRALREEAPEK